MTETTKPVNLMRTAEVLRMCGIQYEVDSDGNLCFWIPPDEGDPAAFFVWLTCTDFTLAVSGGLEVLYDAGAGRINDLLVGYQREFWAPTGYSVEREDRVRIYGREAVPHRGGSKRPAAGRVDYARPRRRSGVRPHPGPQARLALAGRGRHRKRRGS